MSYCRHCGRKEIQGGLACIHANPPSSFSAFIIYVLFMILPVIMISFCHHLSKIASVSLAILLLLILITIIDILTKKDYLALFFGCHQKINRSLTIKKYVFPLCSRCLGIYIGIYIFTLIHLFYTFPFYVYILFSMPLIIDGLYQSIQQRESTHFKRLITGILFSASFIYIIYLLHYLIIILSQWIYQFIT